jgi:hypothetical protein
MNAHDQQRIEQLLKQALPPVGDAEPAHDLWPSMLQRLDAGTALPWFDWALAGGIAIFSLALPTSIPVILYYL